LSCPRDIFLSRAIRVTTVFYTYILGIFILCLQYTTSPDSFLGCHQLLIFTDPAMKPIIYILGTLGLYYVTINQRTYFKLSPIRLFPLFP